MFFSFYFEYKINKEYLLMITIFMPDSQLRTEVKTEEVGIVTENSNFVIRCSVNFIKIKSQKHSAGVQGISVGQQTMLLLLISNN